MAGNQDVAYTLDEAVDELLRNLHGLGVQYEPTADRYHVIAHVLNRALRAVALDNEWSWYFEDAELGVVQQGDRTVEMTSRQRLRIVQDDAIRLETDAGLPVRWIYLLPRDALHKYASVPGLWASATRSTIKFSRPIRQDEAGLRVMAPIMREPKMFDVPDPGQEVGPSVRNQQLDFDYPDLVIMKAMYMYAQTDPVIQPRVPTLEENYNTLKYALIERDTQFTDSPYRNDWILNISNAPGRRETYSPMYPHATGVMGRG